MANRDRQTSVANLRSGGATTKFLNENGSYSTPAGGGGVTWNFDLAQYAGDQLAPALSAGNFSVGNIILPTRVSVKTTGLHFWWAGGAGALTVKATLRTNGSKISQTAVYSTLTDTAGNVAVNAAGVYTASWTSELTLVQNQFYAIQIYETTGAKFPANSTWTNLKMISQNLTNNWFLDPGGLFLIETGFAAGDAAIATDAGTSAFYPVSIVVSG